MADEAKQDLAQRSKFAGAPSPSKFWAPQEGVNKDNICLLHSLTAERSDCRQILPPQLKKQTHLLMSLFFTLKGKI
ncbi:MAG: hypothetical protein E7515_08495 [Ruminococcaceae bacterium]|nr:hypothetical protein [Oscillospiraceae bacterium]